VWHSFPTASAAWLGTFTASGSSYDTAPAQPFYVLQEAVVRADLWVMEPAGSYSGVASDARSGLDLVSCNGVPAPLSGSTFACDVELSGHTPVTIMASDVAGNEAVFTQTVTSASDALDVVYATSFEWIWDDSERSCVRRRVLSAGRDAWRLYAVGTMARATMGRRAGLWSPGSDQRRLAAPVGTS
jgi:hypothetical protein